MMHGLTNLKFKKLLAGIFRNDFNKFTKGKPVPEKRKIVVARSIRKETSLEKWENFCGLSVRTISGETVKAFHRQRLQILIN